MGSIRPLITITILVVVGAYLYVKINEGPIRPHAGANEAFNQPPDGVPPLATTNGASLASDSAAPPWPPAASVAAPTASSNPVAPAPAGSAPSVSDTAKDNLPAVPAIPELPELPAATDVSPAPGQPLVPLPNDLPKDIPVAQYPDDPGQSSNAAASIDASNPITPLAPFAPGPAGVASPQAAADPFAPVPPITNPLTPLPDSRATAGGIPPLPTNATGVGVLDPSSPPQAASQNPLRQPTQTPPAPAPSPDRYSSGAATPSGNQLNIGATAASQAIVPAAASFAASWPAVQAALDRGELNQAHQLLSKWHGDESLAPVDAQKVETLLSQLAGTVIYSADYQLEPARVVKPGETLETIAKGYNVPWQLLAKINGIQSPDQLPPGQKLKVVRGPFSAVVDLHRNELTLLIDGRYAGKFPVTVPPGSTVTEGQWLVDQKLAGPQSTAAPTVYAVAPVPADRTIVLRGESNPGSPPGGPTLMIASGSPSGGLTATAPTIRVAPQDAEEISDILSIGSRVVVRR